MAGAMTLSSSFSLTFDTLPRIIIFYENWWDGSEEAYCFWVRSVNNTYENCGINGMSATAISVNGKTIAGELSHHHENDSIHQYMAIY